MDPMGRAIADYFKNKTMVIDYTFPQLQVDTKDRTYGSGYGKGRVLDVGVTI